MAAAIRAVPTIAAADDAIIIGIEMNSITRILSATASSLLLSFGFSRLAEKLDPLASQLNERTQGLLHEADPSSLPCLIATFSAQ